MSYLIHLPLVRKVSPNAQPWRTAIISTRWPSGGVSRISAVPSDEDCGYWAGRGRQTLALNAPKEADGRIIVRADGLNTGAIP